MQHRGKIPAAHSSGTPSTSANLATGSIPASLKSSVANLMALGQPFTFGQDSAGMANNSHPVFYILRPKRITGYVERSHCKCGGGLCRWHCFVNQPRPFAFTSAFCGWPGVLNCPTEASYLEKLLENLLSDLLTANLQQAEVEPQLPLDKNKDGASRTSQVMVSRFSYRWRSHAVQVADFADMPPLLREGLARLRTVFSRTCCGHQTNGLVEH